jgi:type I restriction enzyme R subunit
MSEKDIVDELERKLEELGWKKYAKCLERRDDIIIEEIFRDALAKLNEKELASRGLDKDVDLVLSKVKDFLVRAEPHEFLDYLKSGFYVEVGRKKAKIELIDFLQKIDNNVFVFCREASFSGKRKDRPDVTLYINGIPLVVVEAKDPFRLGERAIEEGVSQLMRYERELPELFKYVQIGIAYTDKENSVYLPMSSTLRGRERWQGRWRNDRDEYDIYDLLDRSRLLDILQWFVFYKGKTYSSKIIPRYNQYWATKKALNRITEYLNNSGKRNRGLVWHWQGSGKTYTMFYIAYQFYKRFYERDPLVFFIVDRRELQRQLYDEFIKDIYAPYFQDVIKIVNSIEELKSILVEIHESEASRQSIQRGVYVVLIEKFRPKDLEELEPIRKKEILVLLDEAHRSLYGELGATLNRLLPNAIKLAFTGTPVMKYERNTFELFAYPPEEFYLDKYFIRDSIRDGYTLPIKYQVVQEIDGVRINVSEDEIKSLLEEWGEKAKEIGSLDDLAEEEEFLHISATRQEIRRRLNKIKVFLENPERLKLIANDIARRIKDDTEDFRFKAMVVVASRLACVRMKRFLDEALTAMYGEEARRWSEVVMTYNENRDPEEIDSYRRKMLETWRGGEGGGVKDWEEANRIIQDSFKDEEYPRILIVTDMLITGFDCPRLKVMYLDKPLYEHRLLQAIARVNRPYRTKELEKKFGLIVDYVGLLENVKETISRYEMLDKDTYTELFEESVSKLENSLEELSHIIDDIKQTLRNGIKIGAYEIKLDIDKIKELSRKGGDIYKELSEATKVLAIGYRIGSIQVLDLLGKIRAIHKLYKALGAYGEKLKFREDVVVMLKIYNGVMHSVKRPKLPDGFWDDLYKLIHEKTLIPEIAPVEEITIDANELEKSLSELKAARAYSTGVVYASAEALLMLHSFLEREPLNPIYREILERLKKLEEEWSSCREVSETIIDKIIALYERVSSYKKASASMDLAQRLIYDIKSYLASKFSLEAVNLENAETEIRSLVVKYKNLGKTTFYEEDERKLRLAILKDLFKTLGGIADRETIRRVGYELTEYIREILQRSQRTS